MATVNKVKSAIGDKLWKTRRRIDYPWEHQSLTDMAVGGEALEPYAVIASFWMLHNRRQKGTWWLG